MSSVLLNLADGIVAEPEPKAVAKVGDVQCLCHHIACDGLEYAFRLWYYSGLPQNKASTQKTLQVKFNPDASPPSHHHHHPIPRPSQRLSSLAACRLCALWQAYADLPTKQETLTNSQPAGGGQMRPVQPLCHKP